MKSFEGTLATGGAVGHIIVGGGVFNVTIKDLETQESALYTVYVIGLGVGLPAFRATSRPFTFMVDTNTTCRDFEGYGYMGGISLEVGAGLKVGGGLKIPNGPLISSHYGTDYGGVDISVSHNVTRWAL